MASERPFDALEGALVLLTTARLTRFVVKDELGEWLIKDPLEDLRERHAKNLGREPKWGRYLSGLDCPWCFGYWAGVGVLGVTVATRGTRMQRPWRAVMATLSLNAVVVGVGGKLDFWE